jgi:hypothetical protein
MVRAAITYRIAAIGQEGVKMFAVHQQRGGVPPLSFSLSIRAAGMIMPATAKVLVLASVLHAGSWLGPQRTLVLSHGLGGVCFLLDDVFLCLMLKKILPE